MSYSYVKTVVKPKGRLQLWKELDVSNIKVNKLLTDYVDIKVEIDTPSFEGNKYHLKKDGFYGHLGNSDLTVSAWLTALGNANPILHEGEAIVIRETVISYDAWCASFEVRPYMIGQHPDTEWNPEEMRDLLLRRDGVNYNTMEKHCIATVNGLVHRTSSNEHGFIIQDGAFSKNLCNRTAVGIIDFYNVGELEFVPLSSDMLVRVDEEQNYYESMYLRTGVSLAGKTPIFVLGGYLHLHDTIFNVINDDGLVRVDMTKIPLVERYYESHLTIDLSSLPVTSPAYDYNLLQGGPSLMMAGEYYLSFNHELDSKETIVGNPAARYVDQIAKSEDYIKAYLDLSQSFMILVDTDNLYAVKHYLEKSGINGTYYYHGNRPLWPMCSPNGQFNEYIRKMEDGVWVLNTENGLLPNYIMHTNQYLEDTSVVTPNREPSRPHIENKTFLWEIGTCK